MAVISSKDPIESIVVSFDFSKITANALTNPAVTCARKAGAGTADPALMLTGTPVVTGSVVSQVVTLGEAGDDYTLRCVCDAGSEKLVVAALLPVRVFDGR